MTARQKALEARKALLNGSGKLHYFEDRGLSAETVRGAWIGYDPVRDAFTYPCNARGGGLLGIHYKTVGRDAKGKRRQWWEGYADDLPLKGHGKKPNAPAKVIPFGMETLEDLDPGSLVLLCSGEEDTLSVRQIGFTALSQPGAGLLEPVYARELAGFEVVVFYDAGEEAEAHKDGLKLLEAGAEDVRVVSWPSDAPHGADINQRLIEDPASFTRWVAGMAESATPVSTGAEPVNRPGQPGAYPDITEGNSQVNSTPGQLLSEVKAQQVTWLWSGRIPRGKLSIWEGDPGNGKSALTIDLTARVSAGRAMPDGAPIEVVGVVLLNAEDGLADTIKPRLEAAGADLSRVLALTTVPDGKGCERLLSIPEDLDIIRRGIVRVSARLVVVDPLMAFLSGDVNSHRDQDVRRALAPLAKLAEETGAAIVVVRHLNKASGGNPLYRGGGSIGITGAARSALLVAKDPEDEKRRVLAPLKSNLAAPAPSLAFVLTGAANGAVRVEWKGETSHTADALLAPPVDPEERSALDEAMEFLRDALRDRPMWSKQVKQEAKEADISDATLRRAKLALGVRSTKESDGSWVWALPKERTQDEQDAQASQDEHLEHVEHLSIDTPIPEGQDEQGAQGAQARGDGHLTLPRGRDNGKCIHEVPGGCWLCRKQR